MISEAQLVCRRNVHGRSFGGLIVRGKVKSGPVGNQPLRGGGISLKGNDRSGHLHGE